MTWSVSIHETSTGEFLSTVDAVSGTWGTSITSPGSGQHVFKLDDGQFSRDNWRYLTGHWSKTLVQRWNGQPMYAGLIMRRDYDRANATLTVSHGEIRNLFARRLPFPVNDPNGTVFNRDGSVVVSGRSWPAAVAQVVRAASTAPGFELPIIFPGDGTGTYSAEWKFYSFPTVDEIISDIEKMDNGPDVHFTPAYDSAFLRWNLRVGDSRLVAPPYEWNVTATGTDSLNVKVIEDGSKQLTGVFAIGTGSEKDIQVGGARNVDGLTIPFMDSTRSFKQESDKGRLNSFALAELKTYRNPTVQTGFSAKASATQNLTGIFPGARLSLYYQGDYFMPDGWQSNYLMGLSGSMDDTINFEVQPI